MLNKYVRGSVYRITLPDSKKHIQSGTRPCVIISNDANNLHSPTVNILPLTTKADFLPIHKKLYLYKGIASYTLPEQITTVSKNDLGDFLGNLDEKSMEIVNSAIKIQLLGLNVDVVKEDVKEQEKIINEKPVDKLSNNIEEKNSVNKNRKYSGMSPIEKFNAKYNKVEKVRKKRESWDLERKQALVDEYYADPKSEHNRLKLMKDYGLTNIKMLQTYAAKFRRELNGDK